MSVSHDYSQPGAIYLRLSKDDEGAGESASIANQRKLLLRYAAEHHFTITKEYVDDGFSGTTFDRPAFRQMIEDVKAGGIRLLLTKDLSRLGRDYIKTGEFTEFFFPSHKVRFIAVGDGYDSASSSSDFIPFRNVINEMYARDISRKIRSSLQVRMEEGSYIGSFPPYGYKIQEETARKRRTLFPDPETAPVTAFLFAQAASGSRPSALARLLNEKKLPSPMELRLQRNPQLLRPERPRLWTANTIIKLLHNPVYLGHMVQGKTKKISFKSKAVLPVSPGERITVLHTHPALVTEECFFQCQRQLEKRNSRRISLPAIDQPWPWALAATPPESSAAGSSTPPGNGSSPY